MHVDHIGYAVRDICRAKDQLECLGWMFADIVDDADRNVRICFGELDGQRIELVAPMGGPSPVDQILAKVGAGPYHICYGCQDIDDAVSSLRHAGYKLTLPPAPAIAFGGRRVAFLYSLGGGFANSSRRGLSQ